MRLVYTTQPDPEIVGSVRYMWTLTLPNGKKYTYGALIDDECKDLEAEIKFHEGEAARVIGRML